MQLLQSLILNMAYVSLLMCPFFVAINFYITKTKKKKFKSKLSSNKIVNTHKRKQNIKEKP